MKTNKLIVILGPTASGKTDLAIKLARKFNGEVVCADSRQVYRGMKIGTASLNLRGSIPRKTNGGSSPVYSATYKGIPHHLFHIISPNQTFSVAQYQKLAIKAIKDIQKRGKVPFLVGGTAFYIYSVVKGWQFPKSKANKGLRKKLEAKSPAKLFEILKKLDKTRAKNIDKNNKRRLIRAIEMAKEFGKVPQMQKNPLFDCLILGIKTSQQGLAKRIEKRTEKMFKQGLEKEVKALIKKYGWTSVLQNTIGYAEWRNLPNLTKSSPGLDLVKFKDKTKKELRELIALHTMQFAKKQMTWFKKDKRIKWVQNGEKAWEIIKKFLNNP